MKEVTVIVDDQNDVIKLQIDGENVIPPYSFTVDSKKEEIKTARAAAFLIACNFYTCKVSELHF